MNAVRDPLVLRKNAYNVKPARISVMVVAELVTKSATKKNLDPIIQKETKAKNNTLLTNITTGLKLNDVFRAKDNEQETIY